MKIKPLVGPYGKMPILIRDDDTNFFTRPGMLETIHSKAWDKGFKIVYLLFISKKRSKMFVCLRKCAIPVYCILLQIMMSWLNSSDSQGSKNKYFKNGLKDHSRSRMVTAKDFTIRIHI
jgi:hypothetical protein